MLLDANDGGIFLSYDGGVSWQSRCDGLGATEIYNAAQSNLQRDLVSIGTQDNGELYFDNGTWRTNRGGDWGAQMAFSYLGANVVYYSDNGNRRPVNGSETSYNLPVTAANSILLSFNKKIPNTGLASKTEVYLSQTLNNALPSWVQVGTISSNIVALHSSFADSSVVYAVDDNNKIYRCDNVFASSPVWNFFATPGATSVSSSVTSIANNINVVYVTCGDKVYRSTNKGQTFTNVSSGIPAGINIIGMYHDEFSANEDVYVCTSQNVFYKNASMGSWQNISYNLPSIANISEFMFHNPGNAASVLRVGYYGRGVWELPINTSYPPAPDFSADQFIVCPNITINFSDLSFGNPTTWSWSFPGGTPSTAVSQNPSVAYPAPGIYAVTLTVGNANGNNSIKKTSYITVTSPQSLPISEGFAGAFPPVQWTLFDDANDGVNWQLNSSVGGYATSSECTFFDNFDIDATGKYDELRTETFDLGTITQPVLTFDVAYAPYGGQYMDTLAVLVSTDCGINFTQLYLKGGPTLGTAAQNTNLFIPAATDWRTDTVNLSAYAGQSEVLVAFKNIGHYGNAIYIDNIDLLDKATSSINEQSDPFGISVFPNPTDQFVSVSVRAKENKTWNISLRNYLGQTVYTSVIENPGKVFSCVIDLSPFASGIYFVNFTSGPEIFTKKIVKEK
jgi:PKD repeat protein